MFDVSFLSNAIQIVAGGGAIAAAAWRIFITPNRKFKADVIKVLAKVEARLSALEDNNAQFEPKLQTEVDQLEKDFQREVQSLDKSIDDLKSMVDDHMDRMESKNEKLFDILLKYFADKKE